MAILEKIAKVTQNIYTSGHINLSTYIGQWTTDQSIHHLVNHTITVMVQKMDQ